jgi:hypothetical protein
MLRGGIPRFLDSPLHIKKLFVGAKERGWKWTERERYSEFG